MKLYHAALILVPISMPSFGGVLPGGSKQVVAASIDGWNTKCYEEWAKGIPIFSCSAEYSLDGGWVLLKFSEGRLDVAVSDLDCDSLDGGVSEKLPIIQLHAVSSAIERAAKAPGSHCKAPILTREVLNTADSVGRLLSEATSR